MVYHPYAQQYLLECSYQNVDIARHFITYMEVCEIPFLMIWTEPRNLFDYPDGCNRFVSLDWIDSNTDTVKKWNKFASNLSHIDNLYIIDDRITTDNFIINSRDKATIQAYIYRIESLGVQCYIVTNND